jgi:hypothetical protein
MGPTAGSCIEKDNKIAKENELSFCLLAICHIEIAGFRHPKLSSFTLSVIRRHFSFLFIFGLASLD